MTNIFKIIATFFLTFCINAYAQLPYSLTTSIQTFQYLSSPTVLSGTSQVITLPFSFTMLGSTSTTATVNVTNDGYINFGSVGIVSFSGQMNIQDASTQTAYEVIGTSPNRIFKLEWKNQGLSYSSAKNDSVTYQVWLFETSNVIEWRFGPNAWYSGSFASNPLVILVGPSNYNINGNPASPVFSQCTTCHLNGIPVTGKVYTLTPAASKVNESEMLADAHLYPNPSNGIFYLKVKSNNLSFEYDLHGITGELITKGTLDGNSNLSFEIERPGLYFLSLNDGVTRCTRRIMIQK